MRKLLFNYSLYSHPEIGNFRVWQSSAAREREAEHDAAPLLLTTPQATTAPGFPSASAQYCFASASGLLRPTFPSASPCLGPSPPDLYICVAVPRLFSRRKGNRLNHKGKAEKGRWSLAEPRQCGSASYVEAVLGFTCSFRDGTAPKSPVWQGSGWSRGWS
jgi:hypothetical protein